MILKKELKNLNIFSALSEADFARAYELIYQHGIERFAKAGEIIFTPGHLAKCVCFILSGLVKSKNYTSEGKEMNVAYFNPDMHSMIFFITCFSESPIKAYYFAETDTKVLLISKEDIIMMMNEVPGLRDSLLHSFCSSMEARLEHLYNLEYKKIRQRICAYLINRYQKKQLTSESFSVVIPFRQEDFATFLYTSRAALSRELHSLHDEGYITLVGRREIYVPSINKLRDLLA